MVQLRNELLLDQCGTNTGRIRSLDHIPEPSVVAVMFNQQRMLFSFHDHDHEIARRIEFQTLRGLGLLNLNQVDLQTGFVWPNCLGLQQLQLAAKLGYVSFADQVDNMNLLSKMTGFAFRKVFQYRNLLIFSQTLLRTSP